MSDPPQIPKPKAPILSLVWPVAAAVLPLLASTAWKDWLWWAALVAPWAGALCATNPRPLYRVLGSLSWCAAWWFVGRELPLAQLLGGLGALLGLLSLGWFLGTWFGGFGGAQSRAGGAWWALALAIFATGIPAGFWLYTDPPWSPEVAARLLDLSPAALLFESAGADFLRLPAIYGPVGADSMDPNLRLAWGNLAGWGVCVLGLLLSMAAHAWRRRKLVP